MRLGDVFVLWTAGIFRGWQELKLDKQTTFDLLSYSFSLPGCFGWQ
jgi:hypothetical protein